MDLFLSWSGERSKNLAIMFDQWLGNVLPTLKVYLSTREIQPGEKWRDNVGKGLESNYTGIFFLVEENINSPWINFEAGAIAKNIDESRVIPLLHELKPEQVSGPMSQFQAMSIDKESIEAIVRQLNNSISDERRINDQKLDIILEKWYPDFEVSYNEFTKLNSSPKPKEVESSDGVLSEEGQVGEILNLVRKLDRELFRKKSFDIPSSKKAGVTKDVSFNSPFVTVSPKGTEIGSSQNSAKINYKSINDVFE